MLREIIKISLVALVAFIISSCDQSYQKFIEFNHQALSENIAAGEELVSDPKIISEQTLIPLPKPYLLAGNVHPEIYPHDASYSIALLLQNKLASNYQEISKDMLDDFEFMINRYGYVLNGNRTYYVSRSQANILPSNVLQYYVSTKDIDWLTENGLTIAQKTFDYWTQDLAKFHELKNYSAYHWINHGEGPCEEVLKSHKLHKMYYDVVKNKLNKWNKLKDSDRPIYAQGFDYAKIINPENGSLTAFYYTNDRASRVSGYDTNHLYGPFNAYAKEFIPVDHSAKLYRSANDLISIYKILLENTNSIQKKDFYQKQILKHTTFAKEIKKTIMELLWDEESKMFYEYHVPNRKLRSNYAFSGTVYLIWSKVFDLDNQSEKEKLLALVRYLEQHLESPSGIYASTHETGMHWDKPYVWPIHQGILVRGLLYYSEELTKKNDTVSAQYLKEFAYRIADKYIQANYLDWLKTGGTAIKEKSGPATEKLLTGYSVGENYSWNLLTVLYFDKIKESK